MAVEGFARIRLALRASGHVAGQVGAGAEAASIAGQDGAARLVGGHLKGEEQFLNRVGSRRIQGLGIIQGDDRDIIFDGIGDFGEIHGALHFQLVYRRRPP